MIILGIETSCDETGVAIVSGRGLIHQALIASEGSRSRGGREGLINQTRTDAEFQILSEKLSSSVDLQKEYGGVVPELASRVHVEKINLLIKEALKEAGLEWDKIDAVAVANGPGLVGALLVGTMTAKTISLVNGIPLISVNHLEGHVYSAFIDKLQITNYELQITNDELGMDNVGAGSSRPDAIKFPILVLIVSGGHTELVLMNDFGDYKIIGSTIDDAAGEAFDKAAKILGLPYPGGPSISKKVEDYLIKEKITNYELYPIGHKRITNEYKLPRPMLDSGDYNFSFSGLKTALLYKLRDFVGAGFSRPNSECRSQVAAGNGEGLMNQTHTDIVSILAYEFQEAVIDVLVEKTKRAGQEFKCKSVAMVGGVAANKRLRDRMEDVFGDKLIVPPIKYCTDNGLKIALAGMFKFLKKEFISWRDLEVRGNWEL